MPENSRAKGTGRNRTRGGHNPSGQLIKTNPEYPGDMGEEGYTRQPETPSPIGNKHVPLPVTYEDTTYTEPMVVADPDMLLPEGQRFMLHDSMFPTDKSGNPVPMLRVGEVAKVFFAASDAWLRWRMRPDAKGVYPDGFFVLDGKPLTFRRTESGSRRFSLADVERMAHALTQTGVLDGASLNRVLTMVKACAQLYGVI